MRNRILLTGYFAFCLNFLAPRDLYAGIQCEDKNSTIEIKTPQSLFYCKDTIYGFSGRLKAASEDNGFAGDTVNDVIVFNGGSLDIGSGDVKITGTYSPDSTFTELNSSPVVNGLILSQSNPLTLNQQPLNKTLMVASGATGTLSGSPILNNTVSLADSTSVLNLNLTNKINQSIQLNGGMVVLNEDAVFKDGRGFVGSGTIDLNYRTFHMPGGITQTGNITYLRAGDMQLAGDQTTQSATTTFSGQGGSSLVNGNGYTWNLVTGGTIAVGPNHELFLNDITIYGLGNTANDGLFSIDPTSTISLANVTFEQTNTYSSSAGTILVDGDNCKLIPHGYTFSVTGANSRMMINGVALLYEPLDFLNQSPLFFTDLTQNIQYTNDAVIRSTVTTLSGLETAITVVSPSYTMAMNQHLTAITAITAPNANAGTANPVTLNGSGFSIFFPRTTSTFLTIGPNTQLTIQNCSLKDFNPACVSFGDSNSRLFFGNNCYVELGNDITLSSGNPAFAAVGNATINGAGHSLTLSSANQLTVTGANTLKVASLNIFTQNAGAIACLTSTATISLENTTLTADNNGLTFSGGSLLANGRCKIQALNPTTPGQVTNFTFNSPSTAELFYVMSKSSLEIAPDTNFIYSGGDKYRLLLQDPSSTLIFNSCNFNTGTGVALNYGRVQVENLVNITSSTTVGQELEIGNALDLQIMAAGSLSINGLVIYTSTHYP